MAQFLLTTYSQPAAQLAANTMASLGNVVDQADAPIEHVIVPGQLIIRTSAPIAAGH